VFITQPVAPRAVQRLGDVADVSQNMDPLHGLTKAELIEAVRASDALFCLLHDTIDADVVAANPKLRVIGSMTITPDRIDVAAATARGIPVTGIPALVTEATADLAMALLLAGARRIVEADTLVRRGVFPGAQSTYLEGRGVAGKTLGLVGAGRVGQAVARRAHGFGMRILYHDPRRAESGEAGLGLLRRSFDELLREADFVSVHVAYSNETHHLISARELAMMKATAYLINTSRGPVVDEAALIDALQQKRIAGAALDVYEHEPVVAPALLALPTVVLTPHVGSATADLREQMAMIVVDNILAVLQGHRPPNCLNSEARANTLVPGLRRSSNSPARMVHERLYQCRPVTRREMGSRGPGEPFPTREATTQP
jgi:glyoxylate reductase